MNEVLTTTNTGSITGFLRSWTCAATAGSSCGGAIGLGEINQTVTVAVGGNVTFTDQPLLGKAVSGTAAFGSTIVETATLVPAAGYIDTNPADNTSSVTSTVVARLNLTLTNTSTAANPQGNGNYTYTVRVATPAPTPRPEWPSAIRCPPASRSAVGHATTGRHRGDELWRRHQRERRGQ
jgi:hypothetical protein